MAGLRSRWNRARQRRWRMTCRANSRNGPTGAGWSSCRPNRVEPTMKAQNDARQSRTQDRRAGGPAGGGRAGAVSRCRDRRRAQGGRDAPRRSTTIAPGLRRRATTTCAACRSRSDDRPDDAERCNSDRASNCAAEVGNGGLSGPDETGGRTQIQDGGDAGRARPDRGRRHVRAAASSPSISPARAR